MQSMDYLEDQSTDVWITTGLYTNIFYLLNLMMLAMYPIHLKYTSP